MSIQTENLYKQLAHIYKQIGRKKSLSIEFYFNKLLLVYNNIECPVFYDEELKLDVKDAILAKVEIKPFTTFYEIIKKVRDEKSIQIIIIGKKITFQIGTTMYKFNRT